MRVAAKVPSDQQLCFEHKQVSLGIPNETCWRVYCTELATEEKTLFALLPTRRIVPTTITRITASITAYSAMSCPLSSLHKYRGRRNIRTPLQIMILVLVYPPVRQDEQIAECILTFQARHGT